MELRDYETFVQSMLLGIKSRDRFALALAEEVGELCGKLKRHHRGDYEEGSVMEGKLQEHELGELGDILFYLSAYANEAGLSLEKVIEYNHKKLTCRKAKGTIKGSGDDR